ncbi:MAG: hypothetical protein KC646_01395 [Candidatus Cloacimonetes bacterium]|nr:hypothetical protein [Candidatus Cloacimonadota bacterium]
MIKYSFLFIGVSVALFCLFFISNILNIGLSFLFGLGFLCGWLAVILLAIVSQLGGISDKLFSTSFYIIIWISVLKTLALYVGACFWSDLKYDIETQYTPVVNALAKYRKEHKTLPKNLNLLVPSHLDYIPSIQNSPFTEETATLHYSTFKFDDSSQEEFTLMYEYDVDRFIEYNSSTNYWYQ